MKNYFFKKNREFSNSNTSYHHTRSYFPTKRRYNIIEILTYVFIALTQKNDYQDIAFWLKDFIELEA